MSGNPAGRIATSEAGAPSIPATILSSRLLILRKNSLHLINILSNL